MRRTVTPIVRAMSNSVRSTAASGAQVYESARAVNEYLLFHYGQSSEVMPFAEMPLDFANNFTQRSATLVNSAVQRSGGEKRRVLDIGCAVGGLSFELARHFEEVIGIDFSQHFVDAANEMKRRGEMPFTIQKQGEQFFSSSAVVHRDIDRAKVHFSQGDACNLDIDNLGKFDAIVGSNLLCRLPDPRKFLSEVPRLLSKNGVLVLISPYSWLDEYTERDNWIGAREHGPESFDVLKNVLEEGDIPLTLIHRENVAFLIREHERKYQLGISDATIWKKTA